MSTSLHIVISFFVTKYMMWREFSSIIIYHPIQNTPAYRGMMYTLHSNPNITEIARKISYVLFPPTL